jgi:hypothetical protein
MVKLESLASLVPNVAVHTLKSVLGIRGILVRIRIRIRILGSVPLTNGSGCGSGSGRPKRYIYIILQR